MCDIVSGPKMELIDDSGINHQYQFVMGFEAAAPLCYSFSPGFLIPPGSCIFCRNLASFKQSCSISWVWSPSVP